MSSSISFKKKGTEIRRIPGTKFSYKKSQLLTSSGNSSLDMYLGGGLSVGTSILIEDNGNDVYTNALLRYYLVEGVMNNHSLFLAAHSEIECDRLLESLPVEVKKKKHHGFPSLDDLNIAWRYKNQRCVDESQSPGLFQRKYDLSELMNSQEVRDRSSIIECDIRDFTERTSGDATPYIKEPYRSVLMSIKDTLEKRTSQNSSECSLGASLLRIAVLSLGSPLWETNESSPYGLLRFLCSLKSLLRSAYAVAFVTISSAHFKDEKLKDKIYQMADYVVQLTPFLDSSNNKNPMTKGFDGLFHTVKLPHLNSPVYQVPTTDLAFKLHAKKFEIKRLHLPPCVDDVEDGDSSFGCAATSTKKLDF